MSSKVRSLRATDVLTTNDTHDALGPSVINAYFLAAPTAYPLSRNLTKTNMRSRIRPACVR